MGACLPPKQLRRRLPEETEKFVVMLHKLQRRWQRLDCDCKRCMEYKRVLGSLQHIESDQTCPFSCAIDYFIEEQQAARLKRYLQQRHGRERPIHHYVTENSSSNANLTPSKENQAPKNKDNVLTPQNKAEPKGSPKKPVPFPRDDAPLSPKVAPPKVPKKYNQGTPTKKQETLTKNKALHESLLSPSPTKGEVLWVRFIDVKSNCAYYRNSMTGQVTWHEPKASYATDVSALSTHDLSNEAHEDIEFVMPRKIFD